MAPLTDGFGKLEVFVDPMTSSVRSPAAL